jgi:hypothetical protein
MPEALFRQQATEYIGLEPGIRLQACRRCGPAEPLERARPKRFNRASEEIASDRAPWFPKLRCAACAPEIFRHAPTALAA